VTAYHFGYDDARRIGSALIMTSEGYRVVMDNLRDIGHGDCGRGGDKMSGIALREVPSELHRAIKVGAAIKGQTMSEFILDVLVRAPEMQVMATMAENVAPKGQEGESC